MVAEFAWEEMTSRVVSVASTDKLAQAHTLMQNNGFRHLPVVDDGRLVGMLSDRDVLRYGAMRQGELAEGHQPVARAMTRKVITCQQNETLGEVTDRLLQHRIGALPVLDASHRIVGIITSTDLLRYLRRTHGYGKDRDPFARLVINLSDIADVDD